MEVKKTIVFLFSLFSFQELGYCIQLPTQLDFVGFLLNVTADSVETLLDNFSFLQVSESNVNFLLYPPSSNQTKNITYQDALNYINPDNPTKIIIHGWTNNAKESWIEEMASLYHQKGDYNVLAVDWSVDASKNYFHAAAMTRSVGSLTGKFLLNITKENPNFLETVHVIGHSLGGQVASFTGKSILNSGQGLLDRITGLDVAGPLFEIPLRNPEFLRISSSDAEFVDLIHTDAGLYGVSHDYGNVDFFVNNGGPIQPKCIQIIPTEAISCSHQAVHRYFSKTILESEKYEGVSCFNALLSDLGVCNSNPKAFMGDGVNRKSMGTFYVKI